MIESRTCKECFFKRFLGIIEDFIEVEGTDETIVFLKDVIKYKKENASGCAATQSEAISNAK